MQHPTQAASGLKVSMMINKSWACAFLCDWRRSGSNMSFVGFHWFAISVCGQDFVVLLPWAACDYLDSFALPAVLGLCLQARSNTPWIEWLANVRRLADSV